MPREGEIPTQKAEFVEEMVKNQCVGVSRGGRSTKLHAVVDGLGNPVRVFLTSVDVHDLKAAVPLLAPIDIAGSTILANKLMELMTSENTSPIIMPIFAYRQSPMKPILGIQTGVTIRKELSLRISS